MRGALCIRAGRITALATMWFVVACAPSGMPFTEAPACTFTNPIVAGADPWVIRKDSAYYYIKSSNNRIWISTSRTLIGALTATSTAVWSAPDTGWNRGNVWAPELHFIDGRWYIYYAAGKPGAPFTSQRAGVLQSVGSEAVGAYVDRGMLYTGDSVGTGSGNRWAIDLTVARLENRLYAVWSGWARDATTDKTPQQLYIAPMVNPWTIAENRVMLSAPDATWERGPELDLEEGPEFLQHNGDVSLIYSTRDSWLTTYALGQLRLRSPRSDPLVATNWVKRGPVFSGTSAVYGVGHASFTTSRDGSEDWIVYHSKRATAPGWDRDIRLQQFRWSAAGDPVFGEPIPVGVPQPRPAGECR
jgi:GH43 family beta-xylosidase